MLFMRIEEYQLKHFSPDSRPSIRTLRNWVQNGSIPGKRQGKYYFVDLEKLQVLTGQKLADKVLQKLMKLTGN